MVDKKRYFLHIDRWHPTRLNVLLAACWQVRARKKRFDADIVKAMFLGAETPRAKGKRRVSLEIVLGPRQRGADPDAYWKSVLDALVQCGALRDDSRIWCELGEVRFDRGKNWGTTIVLEDIQKSSFRGSPDAQRASKHCYKSPLPLRKRKKDD